MYPIAEQSDSIHTNKIYVSMWLKNYPQVTQQTIFTNSATINSLPTINHPPYQNQNHPNL